MNKKSNRNNRNLDNRRDSENSRVEMSEELDINIDNEQRRNKKFEQDQNRRARERANKLDDKSNKR